MEKIEKPGWIQLAGMPGRECGPKRIWEQYPGMYSMN